jgi:hypothetical protein
MLRKAAKQAADRGPVATTRRIHSTDSTAYMVPTQLAARWAWHPESIRRKLRRGEIESVIIGRRRLIPIAAVERVETEGRV